MVVIGGVCVCIGMYKMVPSWNSNRQSGVYTGTKAEAGNSSDAKIRHAAEPDHVGWQMWKEKMTVNFIMPKVRS
jgi:hypothetical protein